MAMVKRYTNCKVLRKDKLVAEDLWVADGIIVDPRTFFWTCQKLPDKTIDCQEKIIVPGIVWIFVKALSSIACIKN